MGTTAQLERIDLIVNSRVYQQKVGKQPRHLSNEFGRDEYPSERAEPKHRKIPAAGKHRRWVVENY